MRQSGMIKLGFLHYSLRLSTCLVAAAIPPLSAGVKQRQKLFDSFCCWAGFVIAMTNRAAEVRSHTFQYRPEESWQFLLSDS